MKKTDALEGLHLAFIGAGAMGEAMIGGLLSRHKLDPENIVASDRHRDRLHVVRDRFHIHTTLDNRTATKKGQVVVLAVKPQALPMVFEDLQAPRATLVVGVPGRTAPATESIPLPTMR